MKELSSTLFGSNLAIDIYDYFADLIVGIIILLEYLYFSYFSGLDNRTLIESINSYQPSFYLIIIVLLFSFILGRVVVLVSLSIGDIIHYVGNRTKNIPILGPILRTLNTLTIPNIDYDELFHSKSYRHKFVNLVSKYFRLDKTNEYCLADCILLGGHYVSRHKNLFKHHVISFESKLMHGMWINFIALAIYFINVGQYYISIFPLIVSMIILHEIKENRRIRINRVVDSIYISIIEAESNKNTLKPADTGR